MLHIHRAERADGLVAGLREILAVPPPDPFAPEVVSVPTRGMERWLTQRLSATLGASEGRGDGVCANVRFPSPRELVDLAVTAATGLDPAADPWLPERTVWPLLEIVDDAISEPWLAQLAAHLGDEGDDERRARRFAMVRHVASLLDRYALHRPELVRAWSVGEDGGTPQAATWQAELWRRLRERIGSADPAQRVHAADERLREAPSLVDLPPRLAVFGLTRLPAAHLGVLRALAAGRDVHLFVLHPSPALWQRIAEATTNRPRVVRRAADPTAHIAENRILGSWGRDVRELQIVLTASDGHADRHHAVEHADGTLLARLQADVRADAPPPGPPVPGQADRRLLLADGDDSVRIHACHGRARQVEVLRDAILHLLAEDPTLEPRDVIVMCPDIEQFAPLIQATFGAGDVAADEDAAPDTPDLRVRLADRALRQTNAVLGVIGRLLELAGQRMTASQVLDLADREPVRRRFGLDDDDMSRLEEWVAAAGIRWGLDAAHRAPFKLDRVAAGTWRAGLDRVLLGVTMPEPGATLTGGVLPLDDVESGAIDLAGRFAEFVDRVHACVTAFAAPKPVDAWAAAIADAADALTATSPRDAWQRAQLQRILDDVVAEAATHDTTELALPEVRALLAERLAGRPTRANFRTGHLTVCTLMPMRSVPHRVVCLLGLDDGAFPRKVPHDGDDLMLADPHVGERDPRTEDRQLLLDALLAATDRLIVTYTGNDERTNAVRPPAVPVGELLDAIDRTVRTADGRPARAHVEVRHPLQPFDRRNFTPGALGCPAAWSFDPVTLDGARALAAPRKDGGEFLARPLPYEPGSVVALSDVVAFVEHPVRAFLRQRLQIRLARVDDELDDALPIELDNLDTWDVGQRLLDAVLAGGELDAALAAETARGTLPPGRLARGVIADVRPTVQAVAAAARAAFGEDEPRSIDVRAALGDGRTVRGTVPGVRGSVLATATYSRVAPKHRLAAWVRLLALTVAYPDRDFAAVVVGRGRSKDADVTVARLPPVAPWEAATLLADILELFDRGMREPLPLYCKASAAYAHAVKNGKDPAAAGREAWQSARFPREDVELEHQLVLRGIQPFARLLEEGPRVDETWDGTDPTRFGRYALRLWRPLLEHERIEDS